MIYIYILTFSSYFFSPRQLLFLIDFICVVISFSFLYIHIILVFIILLINLQIIAASYIFPQHHNIHHTEGLYILFFGGEKDINGCNQNKGFSLLVQMLVVVIIEVACMHARILYLLAFLFFFNA